jgi:hypothetical protein
MAIRGPDTPDERRGKRKNNRNRILLASLIALALLSLFIFLGNPGLWTPDQRDEPEAEATDGTGMVNDSNSTDQMPANNATEVSAVVSSFNMTSSGGTDDGKDSDKDRETRPDGWGYVINLGGSNNSNTDSDVGGWSGGGGGGGGGGGSGGNRDDGDDYTSNNAPVASDLAESTNEDVPSSIQMSATDSDGDAIVYSLGSSPAHGSITSFNSTTGLAVYTPHPNFNGSDTFMYAATDSDGAGDSAVVSITIGAVDDAPLVSNSTTAVTDEDQSVDVDLSQSVSDPDGPGTIISIANVTQAMNGSVLLHANNTVTYTPEADFNGLDGFSFRATDGAFASNVANVTIIVNPINDTPRAQNISLSTPEDTPVEIVVITNSSDVDGDVTGLLITQLPSNGIISISANNGTVTYAPNENFAGSDSFEYVISDETSNSTGFVDITVTPVNDAPSIIDGALGSVTVEEDGSTPIDVISNVFDPEGDAITITNVTQPSHGNVSLNPNGTITYTPDPDFNGEDSFEFTVDDGNGGSTTGTVVVTIVPVNDVPQSSNSSVSGDEDSTWSFQLNSTDADGDSMTFTLASIPMQGTAAIVDSAAGIVEFTPDLNYNGPDALTFHATDGTADSAIATVSITVNPVNDDPVANDDNFVGVEDASLDLDVLANDFDIDGDALVVDEIAEAPSHGIADVNPDNTITYTPDLDFNGTDSFEYRVSDGNGGTATASVTISIGAINDAPDADDGAAVVEEDTSVDILLNSTDSDGDSIQFAIITMPSHGSLEVIAADGSTVRYTSSPNYSGGDGFTFQTTDGIEDGNIAAVSVTVIPMNDNPIANGDNIMGQEDSIFGGSVLANDLDIDGDSLSVANSTSTVHGTLNIGANGVFSYTPEPDFSGIDSFQYILSDGKGGFAAGSVMITVTQANDAPIASDDSAYTTLTQPVLVKVLENDSDIDSPNLNVGSVGTASHGTVTIRQDGKGVVYTPANGFSGNDQFTYTVTDGSLSDTATVSIKVYNIKFGHIQPPVGGGGDHEFEQGNTASVRLDLEDASGNDIVDAIIILRVQQLDNNKMPFGPVLNATSAGGSNEGNLFDYSGSWYQYNLKTENMTEGKWALYVYMIDTTTDPATEVLLEDQPIDGISTTIVVK